LICTANDVNCRVRWQKDGIHCPSPFTVDLVKECIEKLFAEFHCGRCGELQKFVGAPAQSSSVCR